MFPSNSRGSISVNRKSKTKSIKIRYINKINIENVKLKVKHMSDINLTPNRFDMK